MLPSSPATCLAVSLQPCIEHAYPLNRGSSLYMACIVAWDGRICPTKIACLKGGSFRTHLSAAVWLETAHRLNGPCSHSNRHRDKGLDLGLLPHPLGGAKDKDGFSQLYGLLAEQGNMVWVGHLPLCVNFQQSSVLAHRILQLPPNLHWAENHAS